jgi:hypothetical protein
MITTAKRARHRAFVRYGDAKLLATVRACR